MGSLPLPTQTLKWLARAEQTGQSDAQVLLHLLNRADANDQDVAKFLNYQMFRLFLKNRLFHLILMYHLFLKLPKNLKLLKNLPNLMFH